jgi:hypothetical protein
MAKFRCRKCGAVYEDYYPPDDTCLKCKKGTVRIVQEHINSRDLSRLVRGIKVRLDCGHSCTIGHNLANTLIIVSLGSGKIETYCHNCY